MQKCVVRLVSISSPSELCNAALIKITTVSQDKINSLDSCFTCLLDLK